jgi:hypothetical protein
LVILGIFVIRYTPAAIAATIARSSSSDIEPFKGLLV